MIYLYNSYRELLKSVLRCSYKAALRKGVTTAKKILDFEMTVPYVTILMPINGKVTSCLFANLILKQ